MSRCVRWGFAASCLAWCLFTSLKAADLNSDDAKIVGREAALEALRFSLEGDKPQRDAKLAVAIVRDPDCELAHWHSGQLRWADQWLSLSEMEAALAADERHQTYLRKRDSLRGNPVHELKFARWCAGQSWDDLAEFHYGQVLKNPASPDSLRANALQQLGLRLHRGAWLNEDQIANLERQLKSRITADKKWSNRVQRWAKTLNREKQKQIQLVREQMAQVDDLAIIPVFEQHMISAGVAPAREVVTWLSSRPQHEATESLLRISLDAPWPDVKQTAIEALAQRPLHDFVPQLLGQLVPPIESRFSVRISSFGAVLHRHELYRSGRDANALACADFLQVPWRQYFGSLEEPATPPTPRSRYAVNVSRITPNGRRLSFKERAQEVAERRQRTKLMALEASVRSAMIEQDVAKTNQRVTQHNNRIVTVLDGTTDALVAADPDLWWEWWDDYTERYVAPKNTRYTYGSAREFAGPAYEIGIVRMSCFASGTLVRTDSGLRPIESIRPGHRVLSQEVDTGELAYKVVTARTERPDSPLLEIVVGETSILTTKGHPFWVNGKGWRMAKRLAVGDVLHTLEGPRKVQAIDARGPKPAYNLVVDGFDSYFVGEAGVLVHDNQPRQPTLALTPGLLRN